MIAERIDDAGRARIADLARDVDDPVLAQALKARVQTLARLGVAEPAGLGVLAFAPDWQDRLNGLEAHIDIRRQLFKDRASARAPVRDQTFDKAASDLARETGKPYRGLSETKQRWLVRGEIEISGRRYLSLERHDRVALAMKPPGLDVSAGQKVMAQMQDGIERLTRGLGVER
jgi:hypothetical protein